MGWLYLLIYVLGVAFTGLLGVALLTYVRRTWQLIQADSDESIQHQILDGVDQLQTRLDLVSERLDGLEVALLPGPAQQELEESGQGEEKAFPLIAEDDS